MITYTVAGIAIFCISAVWLSLAWFKETVKDNKEYKERHIEMFDETESFYHGK